MIKNYLLQRISFLTHPMCKTGFRAAGMDVCPGRVSGERACLFPNFPDGPRAQQRKDLTMKQMAVLTGILALATPLALAQTSGQISTQISTWTSDPMHSEVDFNIEHMSVSHVHGRIGNVAATIVLNEADITKSAVTATIDVSTIDTGVAARDTDLKSDKFFDVAKFSTANFASSSVAKNGSGLTVTGNFTLHGITKPVVLTVEGPTGPVPGRDKKPHSGFTATTTISRGDFGIGAKIPSAMVGDTVKLTIELEVVKQ
jgi:polyisoprenoid-binding protein YceI